MKHYPNKDGEGTGLLAGAAGGAEFLYQILGEDTVREGRGEVCIVECRSYDEEVNIPEKIEGRLVTELAPYAFSARRMELPKGVRTTKGKGGFSLDSAPVLCGDRLKSVYLPPSLQKIGKYAFYNCYELRSFSCSGGISDLGAGLLTGCGKVGRIRIAVEEGKRSCLKELLWEMKQELAVEYHCNKGHARLVFPEYYEEAVENTPARVLSNQTHGCGHIYRNCFNQTQFLFQEYDACFPYVRAAGGEITAVRLAVERIAAPVELSESSFSAYRNYLWDHWELAASYVAGEKDLSLLKRFLKAISPDRDRMDQLVERVSRLDNPEALSYLMNDRRRCFAPKRKRFRL